MLRVALDSRLRPVEALRALRGDRGAFALVGAWAGSRAILGSEPVRVHAGDELPELGTGGTDAWAADGFVGGGWFGVLGFGLGRRFERLPAPPPRPVGRRPVLLAHHDHVLRLDADGRWWFEALEDSPRTRARLEVLAERMAAPAPAPRPFAVSGARVRPPGYAGHRAAVADAVGRIAEGELFQVNLCLRVEAAFDGDPVDLFAAAADALAPPLAAYVPTPDGGAVVSLSPELFLRRRGDAVVTAPIKGTAAADVPGGAAALAASGKDAAEHVMIVDLMRNDLGRVCRYGTVAADPVPRVERHPGVWHLVSDVRGALHPSRDDAALLRATFPPGSVTGAPKVQALKVISALEATGREAYTGAVGLVSPHAGVHLNVAIRTFEVAGRRLWLGAGGGVVADSDPDAEVQEAWRKAAPLFAAVGCDLPAPAASSRRSRAGLPAPLAVGAERPRPDPAAGLVETLGVLDGVGLDAAAHVARLRASARAVFGADLDARTLMALLAAASAAAGPGLARLRVLARPDGAGGLAVTTELAAAPAAPATPVALAPVTVPGGLGPHKWADRRLVDGVGGTPLLVDLDGAVLEAGWANAVLVEGDDRVTPPADGRLLPGTVRAALIAAGLVREAAVDLDRAHAADAILLTSSVRRVTPALLGGDPARAVAEAARLRGLLAQPKKTAAVS